MGSTISVLVVDDHPLVRKCLRQTLEDDAGFTVVGAAADGAEAVDLVRKLLPRVVVMDVAMPVMDGVEAMRDCTSGAWNRRPDGQHKR